VSCAYSSRQLLFKTCVGRLRRARVTYSGAAQVQRGGGPRVDYTVDAFGEKLWWRQRPGGGSFPQTQDRANGWDRSDLPRAVLPGRPFSGWSLNTVSTPPPRHAVSIYSTCILTLQAAGLSKSHQPSHPIPALRDDFGIHFIKPHRVSICIYYTFIYRYVT